MVARGIDFKKYYQLFVNLDNGEIGELTKSEYRVKLFEMFRNDLEKNFLNGHIHEDGIEQIQRRDYLANLKVKYYTVGFNKEQYLYINFLHDCVNVNGLYIKY